MVVPSLCLSFGSGSCFYPVLASFVMVEMSIGLFSPAAGLCRAKYIPSGMQGAIMNIYRLPLNLLVVLGTRATDVWPPERCFFAVSACFFVSAVIMFTMGGEEDVRAVEAEEKEEEEEEVVVEASKKEKKPRGRSPTDKSPAAKRSSSRAKSPAANTKAKAGTPKSTTRPRGRAPNGHEWNERKGEWAKKK